MKARKIAQDELTDSIVRHEAQLEIDRLALLKYENECSKGSISTKQFETIMDGASTSAKEYALETKGAAGSTDVFVSKQKQVQESLKATATASKGATMAMQALATVGNMFVSWAISEALSLVINSISDYINRLEISKEKLAETESELDSVDSELKDITSKIKELESLGTPSLTDKEDLERLRAENKELAIRKKYLEDQKKLDSEDVVQNAKEKLDYNYGRTTSRESIDAYKEYMNNPTLYTSETDTTTIKIAQYEHYQELRKQALENEDLETIEILDTKLKDIEESLLADRTELQNFKDDLSLTGEASPELDNVINKLEFIDNLLLAPSENLKNFLNSDEIVKDTAKLTELAYSGELTESQFKESFSKINTYLEESGLTFQDLISVLGIYRDELEKLPEGNKTADLLGTTATITSSVQQIASQLEPQFAKLGEAYKNIFTSDGFTLENVDNSMLEDLRTTFSNIGEEIGVTFDSSKLEPFFDALTNGTATSEQVQSAFNNLATAYFYSTDTLDKLNETTAESIKKQLEELGVANAKEVVYDTLKMKTEALAVQEKIKADCGVDVTKVAYDEANALITEAGASETARQYLFYLVAQEQIFSKSELKTDDKIAKLKELAAAYGQTAITAKIAQREMLLAIDPTDTSIPSTDDFLAELESEINDSVNKVELDLSGINTNASSAGKDAAKEYKDALKDELSDLDTVLGFITDTIQDQIDLWNDQKDVAVDSLETQRDAAVEALEAEKELVQAQIDAIQDRIDAKQDEIDAIQDARKERQAEIDLQKEQYNLERLQNQATRLVYKDGQMVYEKDESGIRDARESVDEAKENLHIISIEKEISALENQIEGLEDVIDSLDKQIDSVNDHFDKLIAQTEAYYDNLIKGMEEYKSRWEEISEIEEQAKINVLLQELGITTDDVLNMSGEAFEQFKQRYLAILTEMYNGESEMITAINDVADGINTDKLSEGLGKTKKNIDELSTTDYTTVTNGISGISDSVNSIDSTKISSATSEFKLLADAINEVATALGISGDESVSGLVGALSSIGDITLGDAETGIIAQFGKLRAVIDEVSSAINGGGSKANEGGGLATGSNGGAATPTDGGGGSGLTGAIKEIGTTTDETLGSGGESSEKGLESESGGEGVIGKFSEFKSAVDDVIKIIGTDDEEGSEDSQTLISALRTHHEVALDTVPKVTELFDALLKKLEACVAQLQLMASLTESVGGVSGDTQIGSINIDTNYKGTVGNAFAKGYNGLPHREKNALRSEYGQPELTVYPDGTTELTTKPTMSDLPKDTVIFNEDQTRRIMNGKGTILGHAYTEGTDGTITLANGAILSPAKLGYDVDKIVKNMKANFNSISIPINSIDKNIDTIVKTASNINNNHSNTQDINISIGDIQLQGVQDVNGLANAISTKLPNILLQTITKR